MCWLLRSQRACFRFTSCARTHSSSSNGCILAEMSDASLQVLMVQKETRRLYTAARARARTQNKPVTAKER